MNVARSRELSAFYFPDRVALIFKDRRWTYRELDMEASALASSRLAQQLTERLSAIQSKLDRLLDAHLNEVITREEYVGRKKKLLHEKAALTERMVEVERRGNPWLEPSGGGPNPFFFLSESLAPSGPPPQKFKLVERMSQCEELTLVFRLVFR